MRQELKKQTAEPLEGRCHSCCYGRERQTTQGLQTFPSQLGAEGSRGRGEGDAIQLTP